MAHLKNEDYTKAIDSFKKGIKSSQFKNPERAEEMKKYIEEDIPKLKERPRVSKAEFFFEILEKVEIIFLDLLNWE